MNKLFLIIMFLCWPLLGFSNPIGLGYLEIEVDEDLGMIKTAFDFNPNTLGNPSQVFHRTLGQNFWRSGNLKCLWRNIQYPVLSSDRIKVTADSYCPEIRSNLYLNLPFLKTIANYKIMGRINNNGIESTFIADNVNREIKISKLQEKSFGQFVIMGTQFIVGSPKQWITHAGFHLPKGIDQIFFLLTLVFTGASIAQTLKDVAAFTFGYSTSLIFATTGLFTLPISFLGPAIAFSIIYIALEAFLLKKDSSRILIALCFGFIHGFSFARVFSGLTLTLEKLMLALVGFSIGIELGLFLVVLLFVPIIYFFKKYSNYYLQFTRLSTLALMIVGTYWFIERTLL